MLSFTWLFFGLCLSMTLADRFLEDGEEPIHPYFPAEYRVSGETIYVTGNSIVPFEEWYSTKYNRSRIDYFGGMVKRYYYAKTEDYKGQAFEIHPQTTEEEENKMVCYNKTHAEDQKSLLPNLKYLQFAAYEEINGKNASKWTDTYGAKNVSGKKVEGTVWLTFDEDSEAIPVRYEMKIYKNWLGKLSSHIIYNYFTFEMSVESEDLQVENEEKCEYHAVEKGDFETLAFVEPHDDELVDAVFTQFKDKYNRKYETQHEHQMRRLIFQRNLEKILATNHKKLSFTLALNKFADRTEEELRHLTGLRLSGHDMKGTIPFPYEEHELAKLADDFPKEYDMRVDGLITAVKDQNDCGSCWAFAVTATIEGALARSNGAQRIQLSEQALIDCSWGYWSLGCDGGVTVGALYFVMDHGIPTEEDYGPYQDMDGYCRIDQMPSVQTIKGFTKITPMDENALKVAVYNHGPVAMPIYASNDMFYSGGIYYDVDCDNSTLRHTNHLVTVVGYGEKLGQTYWIVKNSWGQDWGSGGYMMLSAKNNNCMIESGSYYVVL